MTDEIREMVDDFNKPVLVDFLVQECAAQITRPKLMQARLRVNGGDVRDEIDSFMEAIQDEYPSKDFDELERHLEAVKTHTRKAEEEASRQLDFETYAQREADEETLAEDFAEHTGREAVGDLNGQLQSWLEALESDGVDSVNYLVEVVREYGPSQLADTEGVGDKGVEVIADELEEHDLIPETTTDEDVIDVEGEIDSGANEEGWEEPATA